jgi:hypothetical protein
VDRLAAGHLSPNDDRAASVQLSGLVEQTLWPRLLQAVPMPSRPDQVMSWAGSIAGNALVVADSMAEEARGRIPGSQLKVAEMVDLVIAASRARDAAWHNVSSRLITDHCGAPCPGRPAQPGSPGGGGVRDAAARELVRRWQTVCGWLAEACSTALTLVGHPDWFPRPGFPDR